MPPSPNQTFSVRLSAAEHARLVELARARRIDPSALVRAWIAEGGSPSTASAPRSGVGVVPRWALLSGLDRPIAEALIALTPQHAYGLVVLEHVIQHVVARGLDRLTTMNRLQVLVDTGWIHRRPTEGEPGKESLGKSSFLYEYGWLTPYALESVPLAGR